LGCLPAAAQAAPPSAAAERALLDQYCVVCQNDRARTANLFPQNIDLATAGDHPGLWEKGRAEASRLDDAAARYAAAAAC
jgi:hypothetical protein